MHSRTLIIGVSDVSIGYGSPQVPAFLTSLANHYGANCTLIEPDQVERPPRPDAYPGLMVERVSTTFHPYMLPGRVEYNLAAAREVRRRRPDVLVIYGTYCLPVAFRLNFRPGLVIYYVLESVEGAFDTDMNRCAASLVDLLIFPEENRAMKFIERCGLRGVPKAIVYNCTSPAEHTTRQGIVAPRQRNGRILYNGTIEEGRTFAEYFLDPRMQSVSIDLFGLIEGPRKAMTAHRFSKLTGSTRYWGYLDADSLAGVRKHYGFSIVMWNPDVENQLHAAPNKFFEAIADGVPPITAPHPQCKMLVQRYECGIVMDDWSFEAFHAAVHKGLKVYGTNLYDRMVDNCLRAVREELNWDEQFAKVRPHLKGVPG